VTHDRAGERLVLGRAVLEGDARRAQEVGQVRDRRALADVVGVKTRGEDEGVLEAVSEPWNVFRVGYPDFSLSHSAGCSRPSDLGLERVGLNDVLPKDS
jgi:hypothetical protein